LWVSTQDQPGIGHATALATRKLILLRKNAQITRSMSKSMLDAERLGVEVVAGELMSALPAAVLRPLLANERSAACRAAAAGGSEGTPSCLGPWQCPFPGLQIELEEIWAA